MKKENKYIGTIIETDTLNKSKVIFKVDDKVYIKGIKEKNKIRRKKYVLSESVNIVCDDLDNDFVYVASDNQPYFNKALLIIIVLGEFIGAFVCGITMVFYEKYFSLSALYVLVLSAVLIIYFLYVVLLQPKKMHNSYTETTIGEIIDYSRTERRHDSNDVKHCTYNVMYKYKTPSGNIIHSVIYSTEAQFLYQHYPLKKKVLVNYNPQKCCESCLSDEYNSIGLHKANYLTKMAIGIVTDIMVNCIDEEAEEYLKDYCLVDYIECEYVVSDKKYKANSLFAVPHNRFKEGEVIRIFYDIEEPNKFYCDINRKYSNLDTVCF